MATGVLTVDLDHIAPDLAPRVVEARVEASVASWVEGAAAVVIPDTPLDFPHVTVANAGSQLATPSPAGADSIHVYGAYVTDVPWPAARYITDGGDPGDLTTALPT